MIARLAAVYLPIVLCKRSRLQQPSSLNRPVNAMHVEARHATVQCAELRL